MPVQANETHRAMMTRTNRECEGPNRRGFKRFMRKHGQDDPVYLAHNQGSHDGHFHLGCSPPYPAHAKRRIAAYIAAYDGEVEANLLNRRY